MQTLAHRRDFATDTTLFRTTALAVVIAAFATLAAVVLLNLIRFFTNLFFFQTLSFANRSPADNTLGLWVIAVPVIGGLIVGLMARFGSEKIRGHGIPEAIEAILFGKSKMSPKVAVLKPLSSGIVIGSGGPFGAEGPIIMTGGAIGSLFAQFFKLTAAERKTLLVAGATAGMTAVFGTPVAALLLAVELLLFEWRPRSMLPVAVACAVAGFLRVLVLEPGPLFPLETAPATLPALGSCVVAGLLCGALAHAVDGAVQDRRPVRPPADPLDVVARHRRAGGGHRRVRRATRAGRRLRRDRRSAAQPSGDSRGAGAAGGQGADLGDRAGLGHLGRRARPAADDGRRPGRAARPRAARR
jgi:H+/Cl- antiporter ClcA